MLETHYAKQLASVSTYTIKTQRNGKKNPFLRGNRKHRFDFLYKHYVCSAREQKTHRSPCAECKIFSIRAFSDDTGDMEVMEDFDPRPEKN